MNKQLLIQLKQSVDCNEINNILSSISVNGSDIKRVFTPEEVYCNLFIFSKFKLACGETLEFPQNFHQLFILFINEILSSSSEHKTQVKIVFIKRALGMYPPETLKQLIQGLGSSNLNFNVKLLAQSFLTICLPSLSKQVPSVLGPIINVLGHSYKNLNDCTKIVFMDVLFRDINKATEIITRNKRMIINEGSEVVCASVLSNLLTSLRLNPPTPLLCRSETLIIVILKQFPTLLKMFIKMGSKYARQVLFEDIKISLLPNIFSSATFLQLCVVAEKAKGGDCIKFLDTRLEKELLTLGSPQHIKVYLDLIWRFYLMKKPIFQEKSIIQKILKAYLANERKFRNTEYQHPFLRCCFAIRLAFYLKHSDNNKQQNIIQLFQELVNGSEMKQDVHGLLLFGVMYSCFIENYEFLNMDYVKHLIGTRSPREQLEFWSVLVACHNKQGKNIFCNFPSSVKELWNHNTIRAVTIPLRRIVLFKSMCVIKGVECLSKDLQVFMREVEERGSVSLEYLNTLYHVFERHLFC